MSDLIDSQDVAAMLNVSLSTVSRMVRSGALVSISLGHNGKRGLRMFSRSLVQNFIARRLETPSRRAIDRLPDKARAELAAKVSALEQRIAYLEEAGRRLAQAVADVVSELSPEQREGIGAPLLSVEAECGIFM